MNDYGLALFFDVVTVTCCVGLLLRYAGLRFSHPATPYIIFHLHTVTSRLAGLMNGATALYSNSHGWFEPVSPPEIVRAALYADLAFWAVAVVWIFVKLPKAPVMKTAGVLMLDPKLLRPLLGAAFVAGVIGLRVAAQIPGLQTSEAMGEPSEWSTSSYLIILPSWFGLAVLGHIYYYGFTRLTGILLVAYLVLMSLQGGMRFRVIIALLLAVTVWVERSNRLWPSKAMVLALAAAAVMFFPMKTVGVMVQKGAKFSEISDAVSLSVGEATEGSASDHMFLDEFASALTLLDLQGRKYYGSIYLPLLTLPIPRVLWPDKPALAGFVTDISTRYRPMGSSGMITTYLGEAYANFGLLGIFIVPPLLAILLAIFYRKAYVVPYHSVFRFSYILLSVNLIQVYRDGLLSIFVFTFVNMMPLALIVLTHLGLSAFAKHRRLNLSMPAATSSDGGSYPGDRGRPPSVPSASQTH